MQNILFNIEKGYYDKDGNFIKPQKDNSFQQQTQIDLEHTKEQNDQDENQPRMQNLQILQSSNQSNDVLDVQNQIQTNNLETEEMNKNEFEDNQIQQLDQSLKLSINENEYFEQFRKSENTQNEEEETLIESFVNSNLLLENNEVKIQQNNQHIEDIRKSINQQLEERKSGQTEESLMDIPEENALFYDQYKKEQQNN